MNSGDLLAMRTAMQGAVAGALQPLHDLIRVSLGPGADQLGEIVTDRLRVYRLENAARLAKRVEDFMRPLGIEPRRVPLKVLLTAIEQGSLEDDPDIQDRWAALIATAARVDHDEYDIPLVAITRILPELSSRDATFLEALYAAVRRRFEEDPDYRGIVTPAVNWLRRIPAGSPQELLRMFCDLGFTERHYDRLASRSPMSDTSDFDETRFLTTVENLRRLELITPDGSPPAVSSGWIKQFTESMFYLTTLGIHLVESCTASSTTAAPPQSLQAREPEPNISAEELMRRLRESLGERAGRAHGE